MSRRCVLCNRLVPQGASHCAFDGCAFTYTEDEQQPVAKATMVPSSAKRCPACGKQYTEENNFCSVDGAKLTVDAKRTHAELKAAVPAYRLLGKTVGGKYVINSILGEGGMAVVYQAFDCLIERDVVIKVMKAWLASDEKANERFKRECKLTAQINHPNVIRVYDGGLLDEWGPYLVMEYVKGETLRSIIEKMGALPLDIACKIIIQILRGLAEAHSAGIVHRDLKPDNIIITRAGGSSVSVKILDFGIAYLVAGAQKLTQTGRLVGTPAYIAPEQLKDKQIDERTDLYAVGVIFFEMLTGHPPFAGETAESILTKQLFQPPPPIAALRPDLPPGLMLEEIVNRALAKEPEDRFQSAVEFLQATEKALREVRRKGSTTFS
ncbi:MAG TPA: serine/threonine-protein kinase [Candidatus Obscuribacterales bacterium]